jgi:hypothetical protein
MDASLTLTPDGSWTKSYDQDRKSEPITACGSQALTTAADAAQTVVHQREWQAPAGGAGEFVYILPTASATQLVVSNDRHELACPSHQNGITSSTKVPVGKLDLPVAAASTDVFCERNVPKGHPVAYGCFAAYGRGRIFMAMYGYGDSQAVALDNLMVLLPLAVAQLQQLPA